MRKISIISLLIVMSMINSAAGQQRGVGVGIIVGEPTGISLKSWRSASQAIDLAAAWSFDHYDSFQFQIDYVFHTTNWLREPRLPVYYGIGARVKVKEHHRDDPHDGHVGVRFPVGITYIFQNHPLDLFFEVAPILDVAPETDFALNGGIGIHIYF